MRRHVTILLILVLCIGCDFAAKRRQAEQAKRQAAINNLRQLGEAMHPKPQREPSVETAVDGPVSAVDGIANPAPPSTPD